MTYLLIDSFSTGHHLTYILSLASACAKEGNVFIMMPKEASNVVNEVRGVQFEPIIDGNYFALLKQIKNIVKRNKIDIVHFVYADAFMKYFGYGFSKLGCKVILTFHQYRASFVRNLARKCMFRLSDYGVVHTSSILERLHEAGIKNVAHIEYPYFQSISKIEQSVARECLEIEQHTPVLLALGGTRYDKGLDILLESLKNVKVPFYLLIAGKEQDIKETEIKEAIAGYSEKVKMIMRFLTDGEFALCLAACDFVVLPYRRCFDGASGPLGEGIAYDKVIIGADHGSLGQLIEDNHLGYTFQSENCQELTRVISNALESEYKKDLLYINYQEKLRPEKFQGDYMRLYDGLTK